MSFMFKPLKYDDFSAINKIELTTNLSKGVIFGKENTFKSLKKAIEDGVHEGKKNILIDGYVGANFNQLIDYLKSTLTIDALFASMEELYKTESEINSMTADNLPNNLDEDPVLLFGKLFNGRINDLIDPTLAEEKCESLKSKELSILYGLGSSCDLFRNSDSLIIYLDVIPKNAAVRAREGQFKNIGDRSKREFNLLMRRNYFVDFEVVVHHRKELIQNNLIDLYVSDSEATYAMTDGKTLSLILEKLSQYPFRAKPVYLEGIWGGEFIRKIRNLPKDMSENIAWIFEFIPMEVSIVVDIENNYLDIPFSTFMQSTGEKILGKQAYTEFEGYFPIRFNYDDSWHSDGNMSIQVHPDEDFVIENYNEFGRQDEAYYIVATGHNAKTYVGFDEKEDPQEFIDLMKLSERTGIDIDYQKYVNSIDSKIGTQVMLPAGTIHSSGQNQFILELGSLTIGSYTYKVYDYNRRDKEGKLRPIHLINGEKVLHKERDSKWVKKNIVIDPILIKNTDEYKEYVVGQTDLMYYETSRVELKKKCIYECNNHNQFTVLSLVDGEEVLVYSKSNPEFKFHQKYLEIVVVPNTIDDYIIENIGYQPCVIHKTYLKNGYKRYKKR